MRHVPVLFVLALLLAGAAQAHSYAEARYVGTAADATGARVCSETIRMDLNVGGACELHVHAGQMRVSVTDDALGPIAFAWDAHSSFGQSCGVGNGDGVAEIVTPTGCNRLTVIPALGATTGMIVARFI